MNRKIKNIVAKLFPDSLYLPLFYLYRKLTGRLDPEFAVIPGLLRNRRTAVDIGANRGIYTYLFSKIFRSVVAIEPQPSCVKKLSAYGHNVTVHHAGASNQPGSLTLYVPLDANNIPLDGLASFRKQPHSMELQVPVVRVDDLALDSVDLIKIDVEGHEREVIDGAQDTIRRERPVLLVEIEQRHFAHDMRDVFRQILALGYSGFFLKGGKLTELDQFSYESHQKPFLENVFDSGYVNNFFFIPAGNDHHR